LGKLQGRKDIELNEVGQEQAEMTRNKLKNEKIDLIISSSLKRAKQTAEIINKEFNVDILEEERLVERGYGDFEGITKIELKEMKKKDSRIEDACNYIKNISIYNMETMQDLCKRIYDFLDEITHKYKDKNILLVTHGSASIPIKCYFMKYPLENLVDREKIKGLENCEVVKYEI
jgi:broad specificity phosphatase PhoE